MTLSPGTPPENGRIVPPRHYPFTDAANQAGISRRYGGIHFELGDLVGRATGRLVAKQAWKKSLGYFHPENDEDRDRDED
jgi:hypothetical protein